MSSGSTSVSPSATDVVFIDSLQLSANIGPDCWGRTRSQFVLISVYLHLHSTFLTKAGQSDDVADSVHYGHLSKAISRLLEVPNVSFAGAEGLVEAVTEVALSLAGEAASQVRVVVDVPKFILLAAGFSVDGTTKGNVRFPVKVSVKDLILAVIIGVNPPEREAKQQVIINLVFVEVPEFHQPIDYVGIIGKISKVHPSFRLPLAKSSRRVLQSIEASSYLTLEKFVFEIVRAACLSSDALQVVTVRAQKPSALSFAHSSGVEITRPRASFVNPSHS